MIETVRLYRDLVNTAKVGTSGFIREVEFNDALESVQTSIMSLLAPLYAGQRSVKDLLAPFIETVSGSGTISKPSDYFQVAEITVDGFPARSTDVNEVASLQFLPSRRPDLSRNIYAYYETNDAFNILPGAVTSSKMTYIRKPDVASVVLTPSITDESDYLTPTSTSNIEWPERAYNLIFYMMLDRFGLSQKELLFMEFSKLGIQMEVGKI
jgi:hypothetical protein